MKLLDTTKEIFLYPKRLYYSGKNAIKNWGSKKRQIREEKIAKKNNYIFNLNNIAVRFYLPYYNIDFIQKTIVSSGNYFEINNLNYICKQWHCGIIGEVIKTKAVLDIGANIGNHTLYYTKECGAGSVYCFEPVKDTFATLKKNIEINGIENAVHLFNKGVGHASCKAKISTYNKENIGGTIIEPSISGDIEVISIDELEIIEDIGLVKIDVEGFEIEVLKGMLKTLCRNKPYIAIEIRDRNFEEAQSILSSFGYTYQEIEKHLDWRDYNDYLFYNI